MSRHPLLPSLLLTLIACACSDDDKAPSPDARAQDMTAVDQAQAAPDAGLDSTQAADLGSDGFVVPDANLSVCSAACLAEAPFLCVEVGGACEPCEDDAHCLANPNSLGPKCEPSFNMCYCDVDAECAGHLHGAKCDGSAFMCSCETNDDCLPGMTCTGGMGGRSICVFRDA